MQEEKQFQRSLYKNFFIKKDLQLQMILKIVWSVVITALITTGVLAAVYYYKSGSGYFYFLSNNILEEIKRQSILMTILPSLLIAELVSIVLGVAIGFFSSRKLAVPIFRIEQWLANILQGKYAAKIRFREKEEFQKISMQCNLVSDSLVNLFTHLHNEVDKAQKTVTDKTAKETLDRVKKMLPDINPTEE